MVINIVYHWCLEDLNYGDEDLVENLLRSTFTTKEEAYEALLELKEEDVHAKFTLQKVYEV